MRNAGWPAGFVWLLVLLGGCGGGEHPAFVGSAARAKAGTGAKTSTGAGGETSTDAGGKTSTGAGGRTPTGAGGRTPTGAGGRTPTGAGGVTMLDAGSAGEMGAGGTGNTGDASANDSSSKGGGGGQASSELGELDPKQIYLFGTVMEGACGRGALALVSDPNRYDVGFPCYADVNSPPFIRDGKLIYMSSADPAGIFEFHPDPHPATAGDYPTDVTSNDVTLQTPCPSGSALLGFLMSPSGRLMYHCQPDTWYDEGGTLAYEVTVERIRALADGDFVLTVNSNLLNMKTGAWVSGDALPDTPTAFRAHGNGFHLLIEASPDRAELWAFEAPDPPKKIGEYPASPAGLILNGANMMNFLTEDDTLIKAAHASNGTDDVLYRRTLGGVSEVIYTEADHPSVKIHISTLVSGY